MKTESVLSKLIMWSCVVSVLCVTWLAAAGSAAAQTTLGSAPKAPLSCFDKTKTATKYNNGLTAGTQKADQFFASTDVAKDPKKLQKKLDKVLDRLHQNIRDAWQQETKDGRRCRVQGVTDGFLYRLAQLLGQCVFDGAQWGQFAAEMYCELSAELGGLGDQSPFVRAPAGVCGTLFEQTCDGVYAYVASEGELPMSSAVKRYVSGRGLTITTYPGCAEFTEGAFEDVFESSVQVDCAYSAQ